MLKRMVFSAISVLILGIATPAQAQHEPLDLFPDVPALGDEFMRVGAWNLLLGSIKGGGEL